MGLEQKSSLGWRFKKKIVSAQKVLEVVDVNEGKTEKKDAKDRTLGSTCDLRQKACKDSKMGKKF